ncbi:hypothetical protein [uncultured Legionella sp.]|uniref:hypothetical protein n=1 Tax=uncultured Legionella sp. TaxID=210934 RepID=UPI0026119C54|nr:hypothetical protein [uncultured Legionella sp.]
MPILQDLFRDRETLDSRNFDVWYHNDDVKALIYSFFKRLPVSDASSMLEPFVFFDGIGDNGVSFDNLMDMCRKRLEDSDKSYFPFIFKPELGGAHYMAAILRKDGDKTSLFLFNPLGYTDKGLVQKRLLLASTESSGGMSLVMSPHLVQNVENEGGALVSCGPLCVEFLKYAIENPQWVQDLDEKFSLPTHLMQLVGMDKSLYQQNIIKLRALHDAEIGTLLADDEVIDEFYSSTTEHFIEAIQKSFGAIDPDEYMDQEDSDFYPTIDDELGYFPEDIEDEPVVIEQKTLPERTESQTPEHVHNQDKMKQAKVNFEQYLFQLKIKTSELIQKGDKISTTYNPDYETVGYAAKTLNNALDAAKEAFFKAPNAQSFAIFKQEVDQAIDDASTEFSHHRGAWHSLHPVLKGILGVLATLSIIPALIVATSRHGYVDTFFNTPPTDAEKQLQHFKKQLDGDDGSFEELNLSLTK